ncbi:MAG: chemotaxis protein CheW [Alteromonadaceae bacterium]|nr:chemotaxis protein CheW [Alteromonadaceae bacterium]
MSDVDLIELNDSLIDSQYLTFIISDEEFAVPIMRVKEIIEYQSLTQVPMVPKFIAGAVNLRGAVVPVINLAIKFGMQPRPVNRRSCIVIMEIQLADELVILGILVDKVLQVFDIPDENIEAAPSFGAQIKTEFIQGMARVEEQFIIILSINNVLSLNEISVLGDIQDENNVANDKSLAETTSKNNEMSAS